MSLFWLRTPVESWLGTSAIKAQTKDERAFVLKVIAGIGVLAVVSITALLWNGQHLGLLTIGAIAGSAFAMQAGVKKLGRKGRMPAQIIGAIGLTSTAAGAYYVATGKLDRIAVALWLANWLFAGRPDSLCAGTHPLQPRRQPGREDETGTALLLRPSRLSSALSSPPADSDSSRPPWRWLSFPCWFAGLCGSSGDIVLSMCTSSASAN